MKIISLTAENVKRLVVAHIEPNGNLVQITGKNGNGKTSVLDSIWWAIAGKKNIQSEPIRTGQVEARITMVLGDPASTDPKKRRELVVIRTFKRKKVIDETTGEVTNDGYTTSIKVTNADGWEPAGGAQTVLDSFIGQFTFDPLAFSRMQPREQFDALRGFVPDVDFDAIERVNDADYERRAEINKYAKQERTLAESIVLPEGELLEAVDESELLTKMENASTHNLDVQTRATNRANMAKQIADDRAYACQCESFFDNESKTISDNLARAENDIAVEIKRLNDKLIVVQNAAEADRKLRRDHWLAEEKKRIDAAETAQATLDALAPLEELVDASELRQQITKARETNALVATRQKKLAAELRAIEFEREAADITKAMDAREEQKNSAIAEAKLPVKGLGFGDGIVTFNDLPFDQASDSEQLRASVAIAAAMNPKLRVIRVRDGSLLDDAARVLLATLADEMDMQIWMELVDSSGKLGFVLEDGHVKPAAKEEAA